MELPTITYGRGVYFDISGIVGPNVKPKTATVAIAAHHTVGQSDFADSNMNGTTKDEEIAHIRAINSQHLANGWTCGFGYDGIAFRSGRCYLVGKADGQRAGVAGRNHEIRSFVMAGDFRTAAPPLGAALGLARMINDTWIELGRVVNVAGHRELAIASSATACPGAAGITALRSLILPAARALHAEDFALQRRLVVTKIREALRPAWDAADLLTLSRQIAWISGGTLCG